MRKLQFNNGRQHISFVTNVSTSQISETDTHFKINGVPVVIDGAQMNGITYEREDNEKGLNSLVGKVLTLRHPFDEQGNPIDAYSPKAMQDNYAGGVVTKWYKKGDINLVDLEIKKPLLAAQDGGDWYYKQLENRQPIGVSTGLYHVVKDGKSTEQQYNHLAMLPQEEDPAGGQATFMRFNSAQTTMNNIDEYIAGMNSKHEDGLFDRFVKKLTEKFAPVFKISNNATDAANGEDEEGKAMYTREDVMNMLKAKKVEVNEKMTDDELKALMSKSLAGNSQEETKADKGQVEVNQAITDAVTAAVNAAVKPLSDEMATLKAAANNAQKAAKDKLIGDILAVNAVFTKEELEGMQETALNKLASQYVPAAGLGLSAAQFNQQAPASAVNLQLPNVE